MAIEPKVELTSSPEAAEASAGGLVRAAGIIALGNVLSRVVGLGRETVIADLFGASGYVSIFRVAATLIQTLYDFLVGGMVSAALVPVFSEYTERREQFWRLVSVVLSVLAAFLALAVLVLEILAEPLFTLLGAGYDPELRAAGVQMIRLIVPAVFFLGVAGILTGILLALKRFALPAFTTTAFNAGIILGAIVLSPFFGITSLIVGVLIGSASQVILQLIGLRGSALRFSLDWSHPGLRQILRLYLPVVGGLSVSVVGVVIDRNLASHTGAQSLAWMQDATVIVQFPLGLVANAISFAILPSLSRSVGADEFRRTLAFGLKLVLLLILPATIGLILLAEPVIALLFEHGAFTAFDTSQTTRALQLYLIGTPFAAIDMPLVFAFYARKNTLLPNLVAVVGLAIYLIVALALFQSLGFLGLVLANSAQLTGHALVMLLLTEKRLGGIRGQGWSITIAKLVTASALMGVAVWLTTLLTLDREGIGKIAQVVVPAAIAVLVYLAALYVLRVRELTQLWGLLTKRSR